jgi:hypothetical protein
MLVHGEANGGATKTITHQRANRQNSHRVTADPAERARLRPTRGPHEPKGLSLCHSSDNTDARYCQDAQGTDGGAPQADSCQTTKDDVGKPCVASLARLK